MADLAFIVNPASGNGRTRRHWPGHRRVFERILGTGFVAHETRGPGDANALTRAALDAGAATVVAVGGDGTLNEVVNGYLDAGGRARHPEARIAVFPIGTGADFAKTLGLSKDPADVARRILRGDIRVIDAGRCAYATAEGVPSRCFINIAEFGSGGAVVDRVNRTTKILGGRMSFLIAILRTMPRYRNTRIEYAADGRRPTAAVVNDVIVANGRFFGGGLMPAPHADPADGVLDVVIVGDMDFRTIRRNLPRVRAGTHLDLPHITHFRCRELVVTSTDEMIDLDGEFVGTRPERFDILPGAVRVVV